MKKTFKYYLVIWAALLALFNVISFVSVGWEGQEKYTFSFWTGYIFISLCFVGQLACSYFAFKDDNSKKTFYNVSLITISYSELILSFVFGGLCMLISPLPYWAGIIICAIFLIINIISVVQAAAAIDIVSRVDDKIKAQTFFIKSLTVDAESLMAKAKSDVVKSECKKVYEAVRYSDPMSHEALSAVEGEITVKFSAFADAVNSENVDSAISVADELIILISDRNKKCNLLK